MGKPFNVSIIGNTVSFNLTNRNDPNKELMSIKTDIKSFNSYVEGTSYWYLHKSTGSGYYVKTNDKRFNGSLYLHSLITGFKGGSYNSKLVVDHINENSLDNRIENLRIINRLKNGFRDNVKNNKGPKGFQYRGLWVTFIETKKMYQCYSSDRVYIGGSKIKKLIKIKIDKYIEVSDE